IMRALAKDPPARQADAAAFAREIQAAVEGGKAATGASRETSAAKATDTFKPPIDEQTLASTPSFPAVLQPVAVTPVPASQPHAASSPPPVVNPLPSNSARFAAPPHVAVARTRRSRAPLVVGLLALFMFVVAGLGLATFLFFRSIGNERRAGGNTNQNNARNFNASLSQGNSNGSTKGSDAPVSAAMQRAEDKLLSNTLLNTDDLAPLTPIELRLLSNAVFARYGRAFENVNVRRYFQSRPWYRERADFSEGQLTDADRANAEMIKAFENGRPGGQQDDSAVRKGVREALDGWADATRDRDLDAHMSFYADTLQTYYLKPNVSATQVRAERARAFERYDDMDVKLEHVEIKPDASGTRATVTLDKTWEFNADDKRSTGSVRQMLWLAKVGDRWLITGEKDLEVHYTRSEQTP
ncbi:MAG: YARHG domain-containing protein, partial [Acidobacteria bacterium]|nr:YARHG domain-containing protein [Acidobacteriota bacterium]